MPPIDVDEIATVAVVVLTMGDRPAELSAAVESVMAQAAVAVEVIVVANGVSDSLDLAGHDRTTIISLPENAGIPGGRNVGADRASAPLVAFLDDDARFVGDGVLARCVAAFRQHPRLGAVALRIVDEHGHTARRHVPRIGARNADRSGPVTAFLGGATIVRAAAFRDAGGYPAAFVYAMEESDLAMRMIDRGWEIHYDGSPGVFHPASDPSRHPAATERTMRNRVWLAHRLLPAPIGILYVANWLAVSTIRQPRHALTLVRSTVEAWRSRLGPRAPIRWRTVLRLTRLGRPPII